MENKMCLLDDSKPCTQCGECVRCDLDPNKICDNCMKCLKTTGADYLAVEIDEIIEAECPPQDWVDHWGET